MVKCRWGRLKKPVREPNGMRRCKLNPNIKRDKKVTRLTYGSRQYHRRKRLKLSKK